MEWMWCSLSHLVIWSSIWFSFGPASRIDAGFISHDDPANFVDNARIQRLSLENIRWIFIDGTVLGVYEPMALLAKLFWWVGLGGNAVICRRVSLALHGLTCSGMYQKLLCEVPMGSGDNGQGHWRFCVLCAVIGFAVHPQRVETLCWASCQPYLLASVFTLSTIVAAVAARRKHSVRWFMVSCTAYGCAVLSKAAAIPLPLCLLLLDLRALCQTLAGQTAQAGVAKQQTKCATSLLYRWCLPHVLLWIAAGYAARLAVAANDQGQDDYGPPAHIVARLDKAQAALTKQLGDMVAPRANQMSLRYRWPMPQCVKAQNCIVGQMSQIAMVLCSFLTAAAGASMLLQFLQSTSNIASIARRIGREPMVSIGCAWISWLGLLMPTLGLVVQHGQPVLTADRYAHVPGLVAGVPIVALLLHCVFSAARKRPSTSVAGKLAVIAVLTRLAMDSRSCAHRWSAGNVAIWSHAVIVDPGDPAAHADLGTAFLLDSKYDLARNSYAEAVRLQPNLGDNWSNLGVALKRLGRMHEALAAFQTATTSNSTFTVVASNAVLAATAWTNRAETEMAIHEYEKAATSALNARAQLPHCTPFQCGATVWSAGPAFANAAASVAVTQAAIADHLGPQEAVESLENLVNATNGLETASNAAAGSSSIDTNVAAANWSVWFARGRLLAGDVLPKLSFAQRQSEAEFAYEAALSALGPLEALGATASRRGAVFARRGLWRLRTYKANPADTSPQRLAEALADCEAAVAALPTSAALRGNVGTALLMAGGRVIEAVQAFDSAVQLAQPHDRTAGLDADTWANRAYALLEMQGRHAEAAHSAAVALDIEPTHGAARRLHRRALDIERRKILDTQVRASLPIGAHIPLNL